MEYVSKKIKKIKQILNSEGWYMVFDSPDNKGRSKQRLCCWALCESVEGSDFIVGMVSDPVGEMEPCNNYRASYKNINYEYMIDE